jgi:hypothetical protein
VLIVHVLWRGDDYYADRVRHDTRVFCGSPTTLT